MNVAKRLSMVILMQKDLDAAVAFYQDLGCKLKFRLKNQWAELVLDNVKISLCPTEFDQGERRTGFVFQMDDVQKFYEDCKDDMAFVKEPLVKVHGIMVSVKDPGGNIIDLYQPTPEKVKEFIKQAKERNDEGCKGQKSASCCQS